MNNLATTYDIQGKYRANKWYLLHFDVTLMILIMNINASMIHVMLPEP